MLPANAFGDGGARRPEEAVGPHHVVADELLFLRGPVVTDLPGFEVETGALTEANLWLVRVEVPQAHDRCLEEDLPSGAEACRVEVLDDLLLAVHHDVPPTRQVVEVDAVSAPAEAELDAVVDRPLPVHPLPKARLPQELRRAVLQDAGADRRFDLFAASKLDHDRFDPLQVQEVREQQPRRSATEYPYLCAHTVSPSLLSSCVRRGVGARLTVGSTPPTAPAGRETGRSR